MESVLNCSSSTSSITMNENDTQKKIGSKTSAEKQAAYRKRKTEADPNYVNQETRKKEAKRKAQFQEMTPDEKAAKREKTRMKVQKWRAKKRLEMEGLEKQQKKGSLSVKMAYKSPRAQSKAMSRVLKSCPNSPNKFKAVVSGLCHRAGIELTHKFVKTISGPSSKKLSDETVELVESFFQRPDVIWTAPGIKDEMCVWKNGKKMRLRKLFLTMYLKEVFALFKEEHPLVEIGFSSFCSLRPDNVILMKNTPLDQCKCTIHENFFLKLKGLGINQYGNSFWTTILCDSKSLDGACWKGDCDSCCKGKKVLDNLLIENDEVFWKQWEKTEEGHIRLNLNNGKREDLKEQLLESFPAFQEHVRIKRVQAAAFEDDKKDSEKTVLQCDFAMAYSCEYQDEVQSALWSRASVNLFTAIFHHGTLKPQPYLIVSDVKTKGKDAVSCFINKLVESESDNFKQKFHIYTDGPTSEFKNKFITKFISDLKLATECNVVEWSYFATSHGKGSVDGIGGRAKSLVRQATKSKAGCSVQKKNKKTVQNSSDFYKLVKQLMPGVKVLHISEEETVKFVSEKCPWETVQNIPGILQAHCITCEKDGCVTLFVDNSKKEIVSNIKYFESDCGVNEQEEDVMNVIVGDWVAVSYDGKVYPGKVTKIIEDSKKVNVMKACFPTGWKWPTYADEIFYKNESIVKKLNPPIPSNNRGGWSFPDSILKDC